MTKFEHRHTGKEDHVNTEKTAIYKRREASEETNTLTLLRLPACRIV